MTINLLTIFPEYFETPLMSSIIGKALTSGLVEINVINIRDFAQDKHRVTDDRPYGGGAGMVMKVEPIDLALRSLTEPGRILLTAAKGAMFNQAKALELAKLSSITIICGHYEGVDERVAQHLIDEEVRVGDYVLTGGEPAALVVLDAVIRLLPGVLGNEASLSGESHEEPGKLAAPVYTRPEEYRGWRVPEVLLGGHHQQIKSWQDDHTQYEMKVDNQGVRTKVKNATMTKDE